MKRQDTLLSSSSRREAMPENHHAAKTIGCMSGIFHFVCKYQRRRKFLTFGRKHDKNEASSPTKSQTSAKTADVDAAGVRRFSCDVQRSPTLPAEIRRSNSANSPANFRTPPALVARLMGLNVIPAAPASPESTAEKRQKLLGALEKCDEDLKALKKIIDAVRSSENLRSSPAVKGLDGEDKVRTTYGREEWSSGESELSKKGKSCSEFNSEQPSPVSVLHEFTRPLPSPCPKKHLYGRVHPHQHQHHQQQQQQRRKPGEEDIMNLCFFSRLSSESTEAKEEKSESAVCGSKAMVESVEEVCRDIAWGERREVGRIGLVLQDYICRDLIEETVAEMGYVSSMYSLPFEACKRKLCF